MSWRPTGEEMLASIRKQSAERRANPARFVDEFIEGYAADRTTPELDAEWVRIVSTYPWYADDVLHCVDATLAAAGPLSAWPCDMGQLEAEAGEITRTISPAEWQALGRKWLEDLRRRFVPVYERLTGGPRT